MFGLFPPDLGFPSAISDTYAHNGYKSYIHRHAPSTSIESGNMTRLVLPVFITDLSLKHVSSGGTVQSSVGWDVRFETPAGIKLPHEDISYDGVTGQKAVWLRFNNINAGADIEFYCYTGKPGLGASEADPIACWAQYFASIEFLNGKDKSNNGADLTLTNVSAATITGQDAFSGGFASTILFGSLFATSVTATDALIMSTGDTLVTSAGNRLIFFLKPFESGDATLLESSSSLQIESGDRLLLA